MSVLTRFVPSILNTASRFTSKLNPAISSFHHLTAGHTPLLNPGSLYSLATRSVIRVNFPRPSEKKRITRHGWKKRMSTPAGRRILMNRILKGRFVYSH